MAHFPQNPGFTEVLRPIRMQCDIADLEVEGEVPPELSGMFYRVHPDPQFAPVYEDDQFFNGDGMVSQFHFKNGRVDFRQRYAKTDKWKLENSAGKSLFGAYRNPMTDDPSVKGQIRGTANTNVLVHAKKLYAMKEDSPCLLMDPVSLETEGYTDFGGKLDIPTFTAHPKIDPKSGNFCGFGYSTGGLLSTGMSYFEIDPSGEVVQRFDFEAPYYAMVHDFGLTEEYAMFHIMPMTCTMEQLQELKPAWLFDPSLPFYIGVVRRDGDGSDLRWFKADRAYCACHVMNAFNEGTVCHIDIPVSESTSLPFFPEVDGSYDHEAAKSYLTRLSVDMASDSDAIKMTRLSEWVGEFPRIDDRQASMPYRHGWMLCYDFEKPYNGSGGAFNDMLNSLVHFDLETGNSRSWYCGPDGAFQEPCFVPAREGSAEGEGYLVCLIDDHIRNYSDLAIFEALAVDKGPVARIKLPFRLRQGLHGNWCDEKHLPGVAVS